jgi:hypothetical protein
LPLVLPTLQAFLGPKVGHYTIFLNPKTRCG